MDELREAHLGIPRRSDGETVTQRLARAYAEALPA
jgi:hypothetical protein